MRINKTIVKILILIVILILLFTVRIAKINIINNSNYNDDELVEEVFGSQNNINSFSLFIKDKFIPHNELMYIEKYEIIWKSPIEVDLVVYTKPIIGYIKFMSNYFYFDKDGYVCESSGEKKDGVAEFTGLQVDNITLNQKLKIRDKSYMDSIMNISDNMSLYKDLPIDMVSYNTLSDIRLKLYEIEVRLGDNGYMESKFSVLSDMIDKIKDKKGILYLENCRDNMIDEQYIFKLLN